MCAHRVLARVALGKIVGAVEQRIDRLLAVAVDDADRLALADDSGPGRFGGNEMILRCGFDSARGAGLLEIVMVRLLKPASWRCSRSRERPPRSRCGRGRRRPARRRGSGSQSPALAHSPDPDRADAGSWRARQADPSRRAARHSRRCWQVLPCQRKPPASSIRTGAKRLSTAGTSRRSRPSLPAARMKLSRVLRVFAPGYLAAFDAAVEPPIKQSWAPEVSSMIENITRPMSEKITRPLASAVVHCTLTVSARLSRSLVSVAFQAISATVEAPSCWSMRSASPRFRRVDQYQPPGMVSRWMIAVRLDGRCGQRARRRKCLGGELQSLFLVFFVALRGWRRFLLRNVSCAWHLSPDGLEPGRPGKGPAKRPGRPGQG